MMAETQERNGGETCKLGFMTREFACLLFNTFHVEKPSTTQN
jgi:hypothetical protein